jgi:hypothetical protein
MQTRALSCALHLVLPLVVLALPSTSRAQIIGLEPWTAIAASGTPNPDDADSLQYHDGWWLEPIGDDTSITLRYNITAVDGLVDSTGAVLTRPAITVKFRDGGPTNTVSVSLRRMPFGTTLGFGENLLTMNSNNYPPDDYFQTQTYTLPCDREPLPFDFSKYTYFLYVTLSRTPDAEGPWLSALQVSRRIDTCPVIQTGH